MEEQTTFNEDTMEEILGDSIVENEEDADEDENE